jgi:trk system potassium uptake protein TrkA
MKRTFTIIGLGIFGATVARELARSGNDVIGIDLDPDAVHQISDHITQAVVADARDEQVLRELGVHECDGVVISIGEDIEANLLATLIVKGMSKPRVWAEALNHNHHQILEKLGADHIIHPEHEMGMRLAQTMMYPEVLDYISLGDDQFTVEIRASERLAGQTLEALHLKEHEVQCLLIKHGSEVMAPAPGTHRFQVNDRMLLLGLLSNLRKVARYL